MKQSCFICVTCNVHVAHPKIVLIHGQCAKYSNVLSLLKFYIWVYIVFSFSYSRDSSATGGTAKHQSMNQQYSYTYMYTCIHVKLDMCLSAYTLVQPVAEMSRQICSLCTQAH